jgi:hypothetical protein
VCQADCRDAFFLFEVKAHNCLDRIFLPIGKPREDEQARWFDLAIFSAYYKGLATHTYPAHRPPATDAELRLHVCGLKPSFGPPPLDSLARIGQRRKDAFCRSSDRNFLDDGVTGTRWIHQFFSL